MEILIIPILILLNGAFSMAEMAVVSARKSRLRQLSNSGDKKAREALKTAEKPNNFLSTIQVGITLIAILTGAFAGETITAPLSELISNISYLDKYSDVVALSVLVVTITFLSLIFGELVPKRIALNNPEKIASLVAGPMNILSKITAPVVGILTLSTDLVFKIIPGVRNPVKRVITEEEIKMILVQSAEEGTLEKGEVEMIHSVFKLSDTPAKEVMIPKDKIIGFEKDSSINEVVEITKKHQHSRFPVYKKTLGNIIGFVHVKDIYANMITGVEIGSVKDIRRTFLKFRGERKLSDLGIPRKILEVSENQNIDEVMILLKDHGTHLAVVNNGSGKVVGLITLEDIIEKIVGRIRDEFDELDKLSD